MKDWLKCQISPPSLNIVKTKTKNEIVWFTGWRCCIQRSRDGWVEDNWWCLTWDTCRRYCIRRHPQSTGRYHEQFTLSTLSNPFCMFCIYIYISIGVKRNKGSKWYWVKNLFAFTSRVPLNVLYLYDSREGGNSGPQDDSEKVLIDIE